MTLGVASSDGRRGGGPPKIVPFSSPFFLFDIFVFLALVLTTPLERRVLKCTAKLCRSPEQEVSLIFASICSDDVV